MTCLNNQQEQRLAIAVKILGDCYPKALCALKGADSHFTLLMGLLLTPRTRTQVVEKALAKLKRIAPTPDLMASINPNQLRDAITGVAFPVVKAGRLVDLSAALVGRHDGIVPDNLQQLEDLPGVGPKIARLFLNLAYHKPTVAIDAHVLRFCRRITGCGLQGSVFEAAILNKLSNEEAVRAHHWIVEHAMSICLARSPKCKVCSVAEHCSTGECQC